MSGSCITRLCCALSGVDSQGLSKKKRITYAYVYGTSFPYCATEQCLRGTSRFDLDTQSLCPTSPPSLISSNAVLTGGEKKKKAPLLIILFGCDTLRGLERIFLHTPPPPRPFLHQHIC